MRCVYPDCPNTSRTRGLCHGHYQTMRDRVRKGKASESDLEARGLLLPKGTGGSPAPDSLNAFNEGSEVLGRGYGPLSEAEKQGAPFALKRDWKCPEPTCGRHRGGAYVDGDGVVRCAAGHESR